MVELTVPTVDNNNPQFTQFTQNGKLVYTCYNNTTKTYFWDAITGKPIAELEDHEGKVSEKAISPDGNRMLTWSRDGAKVHLWNTATGKLVAKLKNRKSESFEAGFSSDNRRAVTKSGAEGIMLFWDAITGKFVGKAKVEFYNANVNSDEQIKEFNTNVVIFSVHKTAASIFDEVTGRVVANLKSHTGGHLMHTLAPMADCF